MTGTHHVSRAAIISLALAALVAGCAAPARAPEGSPDSPARPDQPAPSTVLRIVDRHEPTDLAPKILSMGGADRTKRLFNAGLALVDGTGASQPYLAEALPQLNTDTWQVFPDGRMETSYRLRPDLTWQDGTPLVAEDFVFAAQVYQNPRLGVFSSTPQDRIEDVVASDSRTVLIRWSAPYPDANTLKEVDFHPLPRHILAEPFGTFEQEPETRDQFLGLPYWSTVYVGVGPYQLDRWEPGVALEATAFDGHAIGRPTIARVLVRFMRDENTILANVLAGEVDFATRTTLRYTHGQVLEREWASVNRGSLLFDPTAPIAPLVQMRGEYQRSPPLLDPRVRRALAHGIDKQAIVEGLYEGRSAPAETFVSRREPYYEQVDRAITKYPYDPRRSEQLMSEAGFTKDRQGFYAIPSGERFQPEFQVLTNVELERMQLIMADIWQRDGFDVQPTVLAHELVQDNQARQTFAGIATPGSGGAGERVVTQYFTSAQIGTQASRWRGSNRGGWSDREYDRLFEAFDSTLERAERNSQIVQMMRLLGEQVPAFPIYYNIYVLAAVAGLTGPAVDAPASTNYWDIHQWELR